MKTISLARVQEIHQSTLNHPEVYKGCLSMAERQNMADIYKEAGLRKVKPSIAKFYRYRKDGVRC